MCYSLRILKSYVSQNAYLSHFIHALNIYDKVYFDKRTCNKHLTLPIHMLMLLQKKCEKYWPDNNILIKFGRYNLTLKDERQFAFYVYREINLEHKMVSFHGYISLQSTVSTFARKFRLKSGAVLFWGKEKSRKYQGVFEVKSRVKTWQVRGIWSQQLEH